MSRRRRSGPVQGGGRRRWGKGGGREGTGRRLSRIAASLLAAACCTLVLGAPLGARQPADSIDLSLERMVELTLSSSYQIRFVTMSVEQTRQRLRAQRARLRSSVSLNVRAPSFQSISEHQYNSVLGRNEIVRENSRRWEAQLSIRQPVILFGHPTNGYLSANNRVYRYLQIDEDGEQDVTYYNRYFLRYTQPLFQPNSLKNSLEEAELDLEDEELGFHEDIVEIVDDAADDFYDLFENAYERRISQEYLENLAQAEEIAEALAAVDEARSIELDQVRVELANAEQQLQRRQSAFRLQTARLRASLDLPEETILTLDPVIELEPIQVDLERAQRFALELTPRMRQLAISQREDEIRLEETRGRNAFRLDLEFTYGREMRDPVFDRLLADPSNTYTVNVNAYVPIWDWGERDARIESSAISLRRTQLRMEQAEARIVSSVENEVRNVEEFQARALTMEQNLELARGIAEQSLERYENGTIQVVDLLQNLRRQSDTAENFLDAYLSWRRALQELEELTFYSFEYELPVLERYGIELDALRYSRQED